MLNKYTWIIIFGFLSLGFTVIQSYEHPEWGFFGHRRINRLAVFTLPPDMMVLFKSNIDYITEHAIDPDKRRYATKHEAVRHYMDLDHYGKLPFLHVPREWTDALCVFTDVYLELKDGKQIPVYLSDPAKGATDSITLTFPSGKYQMPFRTYKSFYIKNVQPQYYDEEEWSVDAEHLCGLLEGVVPCTSWKRFIFIDKMSEHGILPYHLAQMQYRLTGAFKEKNTQLLLRLATEFGHYIGDAHVPLHTCKNYNGQLTNQDGIHAFWESRIPELFADTEYDPFVGKASYIEDPVNYYWQIVFDSHSLVDSVLAIELRLRKIFPEDQQFCYDERLGQVVRTQCKEFAEAYQKELKGQIEERFRSSVLAIGSAWYTAWVDAGQPDLKQVNDWTLSAAEKLRIEEEEKAFQSGKAKGREHDN